MLKIIIESESSNFGPEFENGDTIVTSSLRETYTFETHKDTSGMREIKWTEKVREFLKTLD